MRWKSTLSPAIQQQESKIWSVDLLSKEVPESMRRQLVAWLGICSGCVFSLVILGGVTRLTRSGLSMTDWKFTGERLPQTPEDWDLEFAKYKTSPEWMRVNQGITLAEFKFIFGMEYAHRMWGRTLGLLFAIPASYFLAKKAISAPLGKRLSLLFLMGGAQGLVGWWMVKSGLKDPEHEYGVPRVSPYRLATHLMSAFSIYAVLAWTTLSLASPKPLLSTAPKSMIEGASKLRGRLLPLSALVGVTAASGAFVAGLQAGHVYNSFPTMDDEWFPSEYWEMGGLRNFFENTAAVQFNHRVLAITTLGATTALWLSSLRIPMHSTTRLLIHSVMGMTVAQVSLGVATLLNCVPVSLGSAHQAGALTLFTLLLAALHSVRSPSPTHFGRLAGRYGVDLAALGVVVSLVAITQVN
ncbi:hypothetical protein BSKO_08101 [Bryopsis sp. KO-2023]|nr:hypothetical protein BSKO_08101 [Bryopsis sp. KO-2023]